MGQFCITTYKCRNNNKHNGIDQIWAIEVVSFARALGLLELMIGE